MGYGWALFSVALVSAAQLLLKWAMMHVPPLGALRLWLDRAYAEPLALLMGGLLAYVCSMGCWFMALRRLPLNKAYPLLSLSYVLVAICALMIPEFNERFTFSRLIGVALICGGLLLICLPAGGKGDTPRRWAVNGEQKLSVAPLGCQWGAKVARRALAIIGVVLMLSSGQGGTIGHCDTWRAVQAPARDVYYQTPRDTGRAWCPLNK